MVHNLLLTASIAVGSKKTRIDTLLNLQIQKQKRRRDTLHPFRGLKLYLEVEHALHYEINACYDHHHCGISLFLSGAD